MIHIIAPSRYKVNRKRIKAFIDSLYRVYHIPEDFHLNCIFVGKNKMRTIASKYKKEKVALPVLSFTYKDEAVVEERLLGEIFLCYPQVVLLAAERNKRVEDMIDAMIKHGVENLLK